MSSSLYLTGVAIDNKKSRIKEKLFKKEETKTKQSIVIEDPLNTNGNHNRNNDSINEIQNDNRVKFLAMHKRSNSSLINIKRKKQEEEQFISSAEQHLVDFMIQDETKFADLDNIEGFYKSEIDKNNKIFDSNRNKLERQKNDMEALDLMIEKELIDNLDYDYDNIKNKYEDEKKKILQEMANKEYDMINLEEIRKGLYEKKVY